MSTKKGKKSSTKTTPTAAIEAPKTLELSYNGYKALPIIMPGTESKIFGVTKDITSYVYFKPAAGDQTTDEMTEDDLDTLSRTIIAIGFPTSYDEGDIQEVFEVFGPIDTVYFRDGASTYSISSQV